MLQSLEITKNFNKACYSYNTVADSQQKSAQILRSRLLEYNVAANSILDVGTGTGYLAELLMEKYPNSLFFLNDISSNMLSICKDKFYNNQYVSYIEGDMQTTPLPEVDIVVSNFALQWASNLEATLELLLQKSRKAFAFSTLVDDTFIEWSRLLNLTDKQQLLRYPHESQCVAMCNKLAYQLSATNTTFHYWREDISMVFNNPLEFMHYLKKLGALASYSKPSFEQLKKAAKRSEPFHTSYQIFFGLFIKEPQ